MKKRLIGLFVCTLLTLATVLPGAGLMNIANTRSANNYIDSNTILEHGIEDSSDNEKPSEPVLNPCGTETGFICTSHSFYSDELYFIF